MIKLGLELNKRHLGEELDSCMLSDDPHLENFSVLFCREFK